MANCFLLLACLLFSFACNLVKKVFDNTSYRNTSAMLQNAALSGIAGFLFSLIVSEFCTDPLIIVTISGIGGFFGIKGLELLIQAKIGAQLHLDETLERILDEANINNLPDHTSTNGTSTDSSSVNPSTNIPANNSSNNENDHHTQIRVIHRS